MRSASSTAPRSPPRKNPLLREIAFFDEKRPSMSGKRKLTLRRALNHAIDQTRYHLPVKPLPVEISGAVVARQFARTLAAHDRVFVSPQPFRERTHAIFPGPRHSSISPSSRGRISCIAPTRCRCGSDRRATSIRSTISCRCGCRSRPRTTSGSFSGFSKRSPGRPTISSRFPKTPSVTSSSCSASRRERITNTYQAVDFPQRMDRPAGGGGRQPAGRAFRPRLAANTCCFTGRWSRKRMSAG